MSMIYRRFVTNFAKLVFFLNKRQKQWNFLQSYLDGEIMEAGVVLNYLLINQP